MKQQTQAYAYGLATVLCWSTIASASKLSLRYMTPAQLVFYASVVSVIVLYLVILVQKKGSRLLELTARDGLLSIGFGFLNPFAYYLILFKAYEILPAQQAQVINYTWAVTLSILSVPLLGQSVAGRQWLAIGLSYSGVIVIATRGNLLSLQFENPVGVALALVSTILWALYWILNIRDKRDPVIGLFLNFLCATPMCALYLAVTHGFTPESPFGLAGAAYIGIFEMGLAFVLWLTAMKLTASAAKIANLIFIAPFVSLIFIYFLVGEEIYLSTIAGLFLVIGGLVVQSSQKREET